MVQCEDCEYAKMVKEKFNKVFTTKNCDIFADNLCPFKTNPNRCDYTMEIPNIGLCCGMYSKAKRPDGKHWAYYPECKIENCPLNNLELLEGAVIDE